MTTTLEKAAEVAHKKSKRQDGGERLVIVAFADGALLWGEAEEILPPSCDCCSILAQNHSNRLMLSLLLLLLYL